MTQSFLRLLPLSLSTGVALSATAVNVDFEKIKMWVGDGDNRAAVVLRWNDSKAMENMVMGVRFSTAGNVTPNDIIATAVEGNRRFRSTGIGNYAYDMTGCGGELTQYDHNSTSGIGGEWKTFVADNTQSEIIEADSFTIAADGDVIYLDFTSADVPTEYDYIFYIPEDNEIGIWLPESYTLSVSDTDIYMPFYVNWGDGGTCTSYSFVRQTPGTTTTSSNSTNIMSGIACDGNAANGITMAKVTYAGSSAGDVQIKARGYFNKTWSAYCDPVIVKVNEPERPIQKITFNDGEIINLPLSSKHSLDYTITPEDATYTALTWTTSNGTIASVSNGSVSTQTNEGQATISVASKWNAAEVSAAITVNAFLQNPVVDFELFEGQDDIHINYKQLVDLYPKVIPENADVKTYTATLASGDDIAKIYTVSEYRENGARVSIPQLNPYGVGEVEVTFTSNDPQKFSKTYKITIDDINSETPGDDYQNGTFWLNEEWFGHYNGDLNYITADGSVFYNAYESQNQYGSFGCTSCHAIIYGGRLYVVSKQANDGGDMRKNGGGRLVVADAKTLKKIAAFEMLTDDNSTVNADGRAVLGVSLEKIYVSHASGIRVFNVDNDNNEVVMAGDVTGAGSAATTAYTSQIGDMLRAGHYVFAVAQSTGLLIIDPENDNVIKTINDSGAVGVALSLDGYVWFASQTTLHKINPWTAENIESYILPAGLSSSWGSWRPANFFASTAENAVFWISGSSIWKWLVDTGDISQASKLWTIDLPGSYDNKQKIYGAARYDGRYNQILVAATNSSASGDYAYNWLHFIDAATGNLINTITLDKYYWFPTLPVFPDKHNPEISLEKIILSPEMGVQEIDLYDYVSDEDNITPAIQLSIESNDKASISGVSLDGRRLTIDSAIATDGSFVLVAESNGKVVKKSIPMEYDLSGFSDIAIKGGSISVNGKELIFRGFDGYSFTFVDMTGRNVGYYHVDSTRQSFPLYGLGGGVYVLKGINGNEVVMKKIIIK